MSKKDGVTLKEDKYNKKISGMKYSRVIAWGCLIIIGVTIIATFITGITGSKYFYGCLFMCIIFPFLIYVALWLGKVLHSINDDEKGDSGENSDLEEKD